MTIENLEEKKENYLEIFFLFFVNSTNHWVDLIEVNVE
jgi:hypothetical protein